MYTLVMIGKNKKQSTAPFTSNSVDYLVAHANQVKLGNLFRFEIRSVTTGEVIKTV